MGVALAATGLSQAQFTGPGQYPSMRNLNGLPGQGYGIGRDGHPSFAGAFSFTTPVAYSLSHWHFVLQGASVSNSFSLVFANEKSGATRGANGTAVLQIGTRIGDFADFTYGFSVLSSKGDNIGSAQLTPLQNGPVVFAIGVMDVSGSGGSSGQGLPGDDNNSRSPYLVGTWEAAPGSFLTIGYGNTRYRGLFGSVSTMITPRFKVILEHDTFSFSPFVAYDVGRIGSAHITTTLGAQAGRFGTWALSVSF